MPGSLKRWLLTGALLPATLAANAATVDLLVVYDGHSRTYFNNQPQAAIRSWVDQVNAMYQNSQVDVQLRLVGALEHEESGADMTTVLHNLRSDTWVRGKRQELGADYVVQLHQQGNCGVAYLAIHKDWSYGVVGPKCGPNTLAHELGHTMGLAHSRRQGDQAGSRYRYGLGHGEDNAFGTLMTYNWLYNAPKVAKFSNPRVSCNGLPCGKPEGHAEEADAATAINNVRQEIAAFLPTAATASPSSLSNGVYRMQARHSGRCADVGGSSQTNGTALQQWSCHTGSNQKWAFTNLNNGYFQIKAQHSGRCLDVAGNSTSNGGKVQQWTCHGGTNQQWKVDRNSDGSYRLTARSSNKVLDVSGVSTSNGAKLHQWTWGGGQNQRWNLQRQ